MWLPGQGMTRGILGNPVWRPVSVLTARRLAIPETGGDTGYCGKSRVAACFSITCQTVSSSIRNLAVYTILAM